MSNPRIKILTLLFAIVFIIGCKSDDSGAIDDMHSENLQGLGTSAEDLLSDDIFKSIVVEFVYANGFRPDQITIDSFRTFLNERLHKPNGISIIETVIPPPAGAPFSLDEIKAIETEHRTKYNNGNQIAVYVFFANGGSSSDTNSSVTLGSAYRNTSIVVFEETIQNVANSDFFLLESGTLRHEFGHILGLVNIVGDDIHTDHEDPAHLKHCIVEDCLMYFSGSDPGTNPDPTIDDIPGFDPLCIADLQAKGGK